MITQEKLKEILNYDPETGIFTRRETFSSRTKAGDTVGYVSDEGYIRVCVNSSEYGAHRLARLYMHNELPPIVDHIDGNPSNNAISNLRSATKQLNGFNRKKNSSTSSSFKGVCWRSKDKKWIAGIVLNGKKKYLGLFESEHEAAHVYNKEAIKHHGEFCRLNPVGF